MSWKPKKAEKIYIVTECGDISMDVYGYPIKEYYDKAIKFGTVFRTKSLALKALKDIKKVLKEAKKG